MNILDKIPSKLLLIWLSFSNEEFTSAIKKYNNSSTPGLNKILWKYIKAVVKSTECLKNIINIANVCINLEHWPLHFRSLLLIIIPKLNKIFYDSSKLFCFVVLLNILGKLIEKVIGERLQFHLS